MLFTEVGDPFLNQEVCYHCPIFGVLNFTKPKRKSYLRHNLLREKASTTNWERIYDQDVNKHVQNITEHIIDISRACIPNRLTRILPDEPPLMNTSIKHYIRLSKRAYRKAKRTSTTHHWTKFRALRNKVISMIRDSKGKPNENIAKKKLKSDTLSAKDWWSTLKSVILPNSSNSFPPLDNDDQRITDDVDKANALINYFRDQTLINDTDVEVPDVIQQNVAHELRSFILTPAEIEVILKSLPIGKAAGPDSISNQILRELATELSYPLCSLFNQSLQTGTFPDSWKLSNVCHILKTSDRSSVSNFRPVSLLCTSVKVFERAIFKHVINHFRDNSILTSLQSGFIPGDSTVNQLTYLYNAFSKALDFGKEVHVVFCDIRKAFDRV